MDNGCQATGTLKSSAKQLPDPHLHIEDMRYYELSESCVLVPSKIVAIAENTAIRTYLNAGQMSPLPSENYKLGVRDMGESGMEEKSNQGG